MNDVSNCREPGPRHCVRSHGELAEAIAGLREAMEAAGNTDNVTFLEMNRWRTTLTGLEAGVVAMLKDADDRQLTLAHALHDIRGTIGVVRGYAELVLRSRDIPIRSRKLVERIVHHADTLTALLDEILTILRCDAGKMRFQPSPADLREEVSAIAEAYELQAIGKGLVFQCCFVEPLPERIRVDLLTVRRILGNLLENAVRLTTAGTVALEVSFVGTTLVFLVSDTGPGVAPELRQLIFEPFQQPPPPTGGPHVGSGLGLSVARRLARATGGDVTLECSSPESGSVFRASVVAEVDRP